MKYLPVATIVVTSLLTLNLAVAQSGIGMTLRPGLTVSAAHFGYRTQNFFAGTGLEFASIATELKVTIRESLSFEAETTVTTSYRVTGTVYLPQLAARVYLPGASAAGSEGTAARPYLGASVFYSLASVSIVRDTVRDTATARIANDALRGNIGGTAAIGGEYAFSPNFAVSGEFGARMLFGGMSEEQKIYRGTMKTETALGLGFTYAALGISFYF